MNGSARSLGSRLAWRDPAKRRRMLAARQDLAIRAHIARGRRSREGGA